MKLGILLTALWMLPLALLAEITLVRDGKAEAAIVLEKRPTASAMMGAFELNHHIKLITGTELPVVRGDAPGNASVIIRIVSGESPGDNEHYTVRFKGKEIILSGKDSPDYQNVDYKNPETFPKFKYTFNGSLYAVYEFLENYCNVHFYGIDELDTTFQRRSTLKVTPRDREFSPPLDAFRYVNNSGTAASRARYSPRDLALWRLRWRQSSFFGRTNHNQYSIYFVHWDKARRPGFDQLFKERREHLFAKGYKGKNHGVDPILRSNYPDDRDIPPQLCFSEPETVEYYAREVLTYYNGGNVPGGWHNFSTRIDPSATLIPRFPGKPFFYPIQGGDTGGYCLCENCKKRFPDISRENVSNSKFQFIADVANKAAETEKNAGVSTLAYIQTLEYPEKVKLPDNVSVQLCLTNYAWWHPVAREKQYGMYRKWIAEEAKKRPVTLWTYIFSSYWDARFHFGGYRPFPGFYPWVTGEQFKTFTADGVRGWFTEVEMQYNTLEAYVAARICFDPSQDPDRIISEYFRNFYGDAGDAMKEFYREVEKAFFNPENCPEEWLKDRDKFIGPKGVKHPFWGTGLNSPEINWGRCGTPERMAKLNSLLEQAGKLVKTPEEKKRLQRFHEDIWNDVLKGEAEYRIMQKRREEPPKLLPMTVRSPFAGGLKGVDWSTAAKTGKWGNLNGEDIDSSSVMYAVTDGRFLYLKYQDAMKPAPDRDIWRENIELFFTGENHTPVYQLAVAPNGTVSGFKYEKKTGSYSSQSHDLGAEVENQPSDNGWTVRIAIPLTGLNLDDLAVLNFIRTRREGTAVWSPIFCSAYLDGIVNFGRMAFMPMIIGADKFTFSRKGEHSDLIEDAAASDGRAGMMKGDHGWSLQCKIPYNISPRHRYNVSIAVRSEVKGDIGNMRSNIGVYDARQRKVVGARPVPTRDINGKEYKEISLGNFNLSPDMFIYIGGLPDKNPDNRICLDYVKIDFVE